MFLSDFYDVDEHITLVDKTHSVTIPAANCNPLPKFARTKLRQI